jgi:hypothetical protein
VLDDNDDTDDTDSNAMFSSTSKRPVVKPATKPSWEKYLEEINC